MSRTTDAIDRMIDELHVGTWTANSREEQMLRRIRSLAAEDERETEQLRAWKAGATEVMESGDELAAAVANLVGQTRPLLGVSTRRWARRRVGDLRPVLEVAVGWLRFEHRMRDDGWAVCQTCGPEGGGWPCTASIVADDLAAAIGLDPGAARRRDRPGRAVIDAVACGELKETQAPSTESPVDNPNMSPNTVRRRP